MDSRKWFLQLLLLTSLYLLTIPTMAQFDHPGSGGPRPGGDLTESQRSCLKKHLGEPQQGSPPSPNAFREALKKCPKEDSTTKMEEMKSNTEAQCDDCAKSEATSSIGKLKIIAQNVDQKAKDEAYEFENELRSLFDKRRERLLSKVDAASCPQVGREGGELDVQKLMRSFESSPNSSKKVAVANTEKLQTLLENQLREELEEAIDDKKRSCARREKLKEYETDTSPTSARMAQSPPPNLNQVNSNNSNMQMQMLMMQQQQQMMAMAAMRNMNGGMGSMMTGGSMMGNSGYSPFLMNQMSLMNSPLGSNLYSTPYANLYGNTGLSTMSAWPGYPFTSTLMKLGQSSYFGR